MLEEMVKAIIKKSIASDYPHLKLPAVVFASIKSATKLDAYEIEELVIHNDDTGSSFNGHITANWYEYTLTVLDRFGNPDNDFPTIPELSLRVSSRRGPW